MTLTTYGDDELDQYLPKRGGGKHSGEGPRLQVRDRNVLRNFLARVDEGFTHREAIAACIEEFAPYGIGESTVLAVTKEWRGSHVDNARKPGGIPSVVQSAIDELRRDRDAHERLLLALYAEDRSHYGITVDPVLADAIAWANIRLGPDGAPVAAP